MRGRIQCERFIALFLRHIGWNLGVAFGARLQRIRPKDTISTLLGLGAMRISGIHPIFRLQLMAMKMKKTEPNNAMERSQMLVTVRADARPAPIIRLAHLGR